jgi:hypothetical protein
MMQRATQQGRYWAMWAPGAYTNIFGTRCPCQTLPVRTGRYGVFAQASYRFDVLPRLACFGHAAGECDVAHIPPSGPVLFLTHTDTPYGIISGKDIVMKKLLLTIATVSALAAVASAPAEARSLRPHHAVGVGGRGAAIAAAATAAAIAAEAYGYAPYGYYYGGPVAYGPGYYAY